MKKLFDFKLLKSKKFKYGAFSQALVLVVAGVLILINLFAQNLDLKWDLTEEGFYSLSKETKDILKDLDAEINIYALFKTGQTLDILNEYEKYSDYVTVLYRDLDLYPALAQRFTKNGVSPQTNSVIVENPAASRFKVIPPSQLQSNTALYVEYEVTNGILNALSQNVKETIYQPSGHEDLEIPDSFISHFSSIGYSFDRVNLYTEEIPSDAALILITYPYIDYSETEVAKLKAYLEAGGSAFLLLGDDAKTRTNLNSLLEYYGVSVSEKLIVEGNSSYSISGDPTAFFTTVAEGNGIATTNLQGPALYLAAPIEFLPEKRASVTARTILETTELSYAKTITEETSVLSKESGDDAGPFPVAAYITETNPDGSETKIVLVSNPMLINEQLNSFSFNLNMNFVGNMASALSGGADYVYIAPKSLDSAPPFILTTNERAWLLLASFVIIPGVILLVGVNVWIRRRHR
jgi:ABC-type uncharacterized transport system involved in gliding motility auxiliary subunit